MRVHSWLYGVLLAGTLTACSNPEPSTPAPVSPPAAAPAAPSSRPPEHLRIERAEFLRDGRPFRWRGLTAFRLLELIAHGREADAIALLDWARDRQVTVVRVLTMAVHLFKLSPSDGVSALPRLLELADERALHVEVVALADTAGLSLDLEAHVRAVSAIVEQAPNAVLEIANEPWHPTQDPRLHDPAFVARLAALTPPSVPVALGSAEGNAAYGTGGRYATWHSPRSSGAGGWQHVLDLADGAALVARWGKPVVSDEPMGAGAEFVRGRRDNDPERFRAGAAVTRIAGLHPTFHYDGGLHARVPAGRELECFDAWRDGLEALGNLPPDGTYRAADDLRALAALSGMRAAFGREFDRVVWIVGVDAGPAASVAPAPGWRIERSERRGRLLVARLQRI